MNAPCTRRMTVVDGVTPPEHEFPEWTFVVLALGLAPGNVCEQLVVGEHGRRPGTIPFHTAGSTAFLDRLLAEFSIVQSARN